MDCPHCAEPLGNILEHIKACEIDTERLLNVGLITVEEFNSINSSRNKDETVTAIPSSKQ